MTDDEPLEVEDTTAYRHWFAAVSARATATADGDQRREADAQALAQEWTSGTYR